MMSVGERVIADLRNAVFAHVLTLSPAFFDSARTGEIASRLTNDTEQIRQVIGFGFSMFLRNGLMMLGALVLLFLTSVKLAALIVLGVPATVIPILLMGRRVRRLSRVNQDRVADVSSHVDESLHEIRTVQAYGHEARTRAQFVGGGRGGLRRRRAPHAREGVADLARDADRLLRGRRDPVDRRPRRVRGTAHRGRAFGLRLLRRRSSRAAPARCPRSGARSSAPPARPSA